MFLAALKIFFLMCSPCGEIFRYILRTCETNKSWGTKFQSVILNYFNTFHRVKNTVNWKLQRFQVNNKSHVLPTISEKLIRE